MEVTDGTSGDGTLGITVKASSASDAAGNTSTASSASTTYTALETVPSASVAGPYSDAACTTAATYGKSGGAVYYKVTYSSPNSLTVNLAASGITVNNPTTVSGSTAPSGASDDLQRWDDDDADRGGDGRDERGRHARYHGEVRQRERRGWEYFDRLERVDDLHGSRDGAERERGRAVQRRGLHDGGDLREVWRRGVLQGDVLQSELADS